MCGADIQPRASVKVPFAFKDLGEQALKNIPEPVQVFQVLPDESVSTPALAEGSRKVARDLHSVLEVTQKEHRSELP